MKLQKNLLRALLATAVVCGVTAAGAVTAPAMADAHAHTARKNQSPPANGAQSGPAQSTSADGAAPGDAPPGSNGTIKIKDTASPTGPANIPHVACTFWV